MVCWIIVIGGAIGAIVSGVLEQRKEWRLKHEIAIRDTLIAEKDAEIARLRWIHSN